MPPRRRRKAGVGVGGSILPRKRRNAGVSNTSDGEGEKLPPPSVRQTSLHREMSYGKSTETTTMAPKKSKGGGAKKLSKLQEGGIVNKQEKLKQPPPVQHTSSSQPIVTTNKKSAVTSSFESSSDVSDNNSDYSPSSDGNAASSAAVGGRSCMQQHMFCNYRRNPHITCSNNARGLIGCQGGGDEDCINYLHPSCMMKLEAHHKIQPSSKLSNHYLSVLVVLVRSSMKIEESYMNSTNCTVKARTNQPLSRNIVTQVLGTLRIWHKLPYRLV